MERKQYNDEQREAFCALAQDIGIMPAIRQLGYPTFPSAQKWLESRGIKITLDSLMQNAQKYHVFYELKDMLTVVEAGVARAMEMYTHANLSPDDLQKAATATQKLVNTWQVLQGKATSITENRDTDTLDVALVQLLDAERAKNNTEVDL